MKLLDKYILKKFLSAFFFVVLIIVSIIVVIDITEKTEKFIKANLNFVEILGFYLDYIPWIANTIAPITIFIAAVFVTSKMASHTEIVAMLSSGVSFPRFLLPYIIGAIIIGAASFYLIGWVIPLGTKSMVEFEMEHLKSKFYFTDVDNHFQENPELYAYVQRYNNTSNTGYRFTLERFDSTVLKEKLTAKNIKWNPETEKWSLTNWQVRVVAEEGERILKGQALDTALRLHPKDFESDYREYDALTIPQLNERINELKSRGLEGYEVFEVEKYKRITYPFTAIILTIMGVIVSSRKSRGGTGFQIALGFTLSFVFILFFIMAKSIAEGGSMHPLLAMWLPNITFSFVAMAMYKFIPR